MKLEIVEETFEAVLVSVSYSTGYAYNLLMIHTTRLTIDPIQLSCIGSILTRFLRGYLGGV